jgi:hypothetical protein
MHPCRPRKQRLRRGWFAWIVFGLVGSSVLAQDRKGIRFWNLTLYTITTFQMSPGGDDSWSHDQCKNDRDGTVDHDERLRITGIEPGRYDVKLADKIGRVCIVRDVEVKDGAVFSIEERQLTDCQVMPREECAACGRAKDRPPVFAGHQPSANAIRLQVCPTPWQRGWRSHPSNRAIGSRRVRDAAPSIGTGPRPSDWVECRIR